LKHWVETLNSLRLNEAEREIVRRFEHDSDGRMFLPVSDILRAHDKRDEAIELLIQGVSRHPRYSVARVFLARELFLKGMADDAWDYLQSSPVNLSDNMLAQSLIFKLSAVLEDEIAARATLQNFKNNNLRDQEIAELGKLLVVEGIAAVKDLILRDAVKRGNPMQVSRIRKMDQESKVAPQEEFVTKVFKGVDNFHVLHLSEVFSPDRISSSDEGGGSVSIELDSSTLAEIYEKQHHYGKALGIYRRLLRMTPRNEFLRKKVSELARKSADQKNSDLALDPTLVDQMEEVRGIDIQIGYLQEMLGKLS